MCNAPVCVGLNSVHTCIVYAVLLIPVLFHVTLHKHKCVLHIAVFYKTEKLVIEKVSVFRTANRIAQYN